MQSPLIKSSAFILVLLFCGLIFSCNSVQENKTTTASSNIPSFPKQKMEWDYKRKANPDGKVPRNGMIKAYRALQAAGKLTNEPETAAKNDEIGWQAVDNFFPSLSITQITHDPNDPMIFYFSTGEGWFNADAVRGAGVWKSTDGGASWTQLESITGWRYKLGKSIGKRSWSSG